MVIWERVDSAAQAARTALSYERIASVAVEIADAEGLDAVSMRKVAGQLQAGTMSLYRYVDSRDDLVRLMVDQVYAEAVVPPRSGDLRADLAEVARVSRRVALRHPWLAGQSAASNGFGPNMLRMLESNLAMLDGYGLGADSRMFDLWRIVQCFVQGYVVEEIAERGQQSRSEASPEERHEQLSTYLGKAMSSGQYPLTARLLMKSDELPDLEDTFERLLGHLLEGLVPAERKD